MHESHGVVQKAHGTCQLLDVVTDLNVGEDALLAMVLCNDLVERSIGGQLHENVQVASLPHVASLKPVIVIAHNVRMLGLREKRDFALGFLQGLRCHVTDRDLLETEELTGLGVANLACCARRASPQFLDELQRLRAVRNDENLGHGCLLGLARVACLVRAVRLVRAVCLVQSVRLVRSVRLVAVGLVRRVTSTWSTTQSVMTDVAASCEYWRRMELCPTSPPSTRVRDDMIHFEARGTGIDFLGTPGTLIDELPKPQTCVSAYSISIAVARYLLDALVKS